MKLKELLEARIAVKDMEELISQKKEFMGSNVTAYNDSQNGYTIKSYDTIIYTNGKLDRKKYSATTSKLQNMIKRAIGF